MVAKSSCASKGRTGRRKTVQEKAQRAAEVTAMRQSGVSWSRIAAEVGLSVRQCQNVYSDQMAVEGDAAEGDAAVEELIALLSQAVEDFAVIVRRTTHDGYRASALRGLVETAMTRLAVLRAAGRAPRSLAAPALTQQMQVVLREFAAMLGRHDVPDEVLDEFLRLAERMMGEGQLALTTGSGS
jgi:hypothetical protein